MQRDVILPCKLMPTSSVYVEQSMDTSHEWSTHHFSVWCSVSTAKFSIRIELGSWSTSEPGSPPAELHGRWEEHGSHPRQSLVSTVHDVHEPSHTAPAFQQVAEAIDDTGWRPLLVLLRHNALAYCRIREISPLFRRLKVNSIGSFDKSRRLCDME